MTCVKYDHVFANDIEAKLPNYETMLAASSQKVAKLNSQSASSSMPEAGAKANQSTRSASMPQGSVVRPTMLDIESKREEEGESKGEDSVVVA